MSLVKYLLKTSYKQKKQDWAEYKKVKCSLRNVMNDLDRKRLCLTMFRSQTGFCACVGFDSEKRCFEYEVEQVGDDVYENSKECRYFKKNKHCSQQQCGSCELNHQYVDFYNRVNELKQEVSVFWEQKFARVR